MYYFKYKFISPEPLFARIREELKSYFDAGMIDDVLFPIWINDCLKKLGRGSYKIENVVMCQENYEAVLPPDFIDFREVWMLAGILGPTYRTPGAYYTQITTALNKPFDPCDLALACDPCNPEILTYVTKTTKEVTPQNLNLRYLLTPGNIHLKQSCNHGSLNWGHNHGLTEKFDIHDNKMITEFRQGDILLVYYSSQEDCSGYQLIPDNYRIEEYLRAYLKYKIFETLYNQITDESFQQIERKYMMYKQQYEEAYIMADIEAKKKTIYERAYAIRRDEHRNDKYERGIYNGRRFGGNRWPSGTW